MLNWQKKTKKIKKEVIANLLSNNDRGEEYSDCKRYKSSGISE